jgi:hypothetical protein
MASSTELLQQYRFRKLRSDVYTVGFFIKPLEQINIKEQIYYNLMKMMFFSSSNYKNKFIQYIQSQSELSLFIDKSSLDRLLSGLSEESRMYMNLDSECYKVYEMYNTCQSDLDVPGVTATIAKKFADQGVPIIITNSFNSSFIIIKDKFRSQVLEILKSLEQSDLIDEPSNDSDSEPPRNPSQNQQLSIEKPIHNQLIQPRPHPPQQPKHYQYRSRFVKSD